MATTDQENQVSQMDDVVSAPRGLNQNTCKMVCAVLIVVIIVTLVNNTERMMTHTGTDRLHGIIERASDKVKDAASEGVKKVKDKVDKLKKMKGKMKKLGKRKVKLSVPGEDGEKWNYHKSRVLKKFAMNNDYAKKCLNADFTYKSADKIIKASGLSVDDLTVAVCDVDLDARITSITEMDESDIKAFAEDVDLPKDVARDMMIMMTMHVKYNLKKLCDENPGAQINNLREVIYASVVSMCEKLA